MNILVLGATSAIAEEFIKINSTPGNNFTLISRDEERLGIIVNDIKARGASVEESLILELNAPENVVRFFEKNKIVQQDKVLLAAGSLLEQGKVENNTDYLIEQFNINSLSQITFINELCNRALISKNGVLSCITSVAGDRGRKSNYLYGSAKKSKSIFLEGLAHRFANKGITVIDIRPGFVDTPMTTHFKKGLLWSSPSVVAKIIDKSMRKKKSKVVYAPTFWYLIMLVIRNIPRFLMHRLNF